MTRASSIDTGATMVSVDAAYLRAIVQGPASGASSTVTIPGVGTIKTLARVAAEASGPYVRTDGTTPITGGQTIQGALVAGANAALIHLLKQANDSSFAVFSDAAAEIVIEAGKTSDSLATKYLLYLQKYGGAARFGGTLTVNGAVSLLAALGVSYPITSIHTFGGFSALQTVGGVGFRWTLSNDGTYRLQRTANGFAAASEVIILGATDAVFFPTVGTTASAANAFINSGSSPANSLLRSTSSLAYKRDVETLESGRADAVLDRARPIWYRSKAPADNPNWSFYGLSAEEMALIDPRLVVWGYQDQHYEIVERVIEPLEEGEEPRTVTERVLKVDAEMVPDGVAYDRLPVLLLDIVRRQRDQLAAQAASMTALEVRVAALETA